MKQENKIKSGKQIEFKFSLDEADNFLEGVEDIFGPADTEKEKETVNLIYHGRCEGCGEVVSICSLCFKSIEYCGKMACIEITPRYHKHYCEECGKKWKITAEGRHYLEKHNLK